MVYDDDTEPTDFIDITGDDLRRRKERRIGATELPSQPVRERITELAKPYLERGEQECEERIYAVLRRTRHDIKREDVYVVVAELRRSGFPELTGRRPAMPPEVRNRDSRQY
jgi:hypothetical protein